MQSDLKRHSIAALGTTLFMLLLFLLLWFVTMAAYERVEDEGIEVSFGQEESGESSAAPVPQPIVAAVPTPQPVEAQAPQQEVLTQEDEAALELQRQQEEAAAERARLAAEKKAREDAAIAKASAFSNRFAKDGRNGEAVGHGSDGGAQWSLKGRIARNIGQPGNDFHGEGIVVVRIEVDATGRVVSASVTDGTNTSDPTLHRLALEAARKTLFNESQQSKAIGTITYHFKQL